MAAFAAETRSLSIKQAGSMARLGIDIILAGDGRFLPEVVEGLTATTRLYYETHAGLVIDLRQNSREKGNRKRKNGSNDMFRNFGIAALLAMGVAMPIHDAAAQNTLGGALLGGAGGAIVGGAIGGGRGAAIGAIVGATTGAAIASEGERRRAGYYYYHNGCYLQRPDGAWILVDPRYCY